MLAPVPANSNIIHPCHTAAILSRETKRALFYHAKPRNGNHGDEARGETKLFWSPGAIWAPCDKGELIQSPSECLTLLWSFSYPIIPSGINPSIGIGSTEGQRKTLTRVGFDHRYSIDWAPKPNFTVELGPHSNFETLLSIVTEGQHRTIIKHYCLHAYTRILGFVVFLFGRLF